jgi:Fe-S-cluster-containing hydrogenase component 2
VAKYLVIDEEECAGCETCVELCPEAFELIKMMERPKSSILRQKMHALRKPLNPAL